MPTGQRVRKPDDGRLGPVEDLGQHRLEVGVGRIIGPQRKDAAGMQVLGEFAYSRTCVERAVAGVQDVSRRVVDIKQDGVIRMAQRGITILDLAQLEALAQQENQA